MEAWKVAEALDTLLQAADPGLCRPSHSPAAYQTCAEIKFFKADDVPQTMVVAA